jgi:hypothetical protein
MNKTIERFPDEGKPGMVSPSGIGQEKYGRAHAKTNIPAGRLVLWDDAEVGFAKLPGTFPTSTPIIADPVATTAGAETLVLEAGPQPYGAKVQFDLSDSVSFEATNPFVVTGVSPLGDIQTEVVLALSGGDGVVSTEHLYSHVTSIVAGPFGGTAGTFSVGYGAPATFASNKVAGLVVAKEFQELTTAAGQDNIFTLLQVGHMFVDLPTAVSYLAPVGVNADGKLGAVGAGYLPLPQAKHLVAAGSGSLGKVEVK